MSKISSLSFCIFIEFQESQCMLSASHLLYTFSLFTHVLKFFFRIYIQNRPFPHSASVRTNNSSRTRLGWTFSYIYCIFVHPDLDSVPLFVGMRERSIKVLNQFKFQCSSKQMFQCFIKTKVRIQPLNHQCSLTTQCITFNPYRSHRAAGYITTHTLAVTILI